MITPSTDENPNKARRDKANSDTATSNDHKRGRQGAYVTGLIMEGARWDEKSQASPAFTSLHLPACLPASACLPACQCLPACLPDCQSCSLSASLSVCLLVYPYFRLPVSLPAYSPTFLLACLPAYLPACLSFLLLSNCLPACRLPARPPAYLCAYLAGRLPASLLIHRCPVRPSVSQPPFPCSPASPLSSYDPSSQLGAVTLAVARHERASSLTTGLSLSLSRSLPTSPPPPLSMGPPTSFRRFGIQSFTPLCRTV